MLSITVIFGIMTKKSAEFNEVVPFEKVHTEKHQTQSKITKPNAKTCSHRESNVVCLEVKLINPESVMRTFLSFFPIQKQNSKLSFGFSPRVVIWWKIITCYLQRSLAFLYDAPLPSILFTCIWALKPFNYYHLIIIAFNVSMFGGGRHRLSRRLRVALIIIK